MASVEAAITQSNHIDGDAIKTRVGVINALIHVKLPPRNIHSQEGKAAKESFSSQGNSNSGDGPQ